MNIHSIFKSTLLILMVCFSTLKPVKDRSHYLNELCILNIPGIPATHSFESAPEISDDEIFMCVKNFLLDDVDYLDGKILIKIFNIIESAQRQDSLGAQSLSIAVLRGLRSGCSLQMIYMFKDQIAKNFSSVIPQGETAAQELAMVNMFNDIVIHKNVSQFCNFLYFCQNIKKIELQGMNSRQYAGNLGRLFIEVLLREFFKIRNIEDETKKIEEKTRNIEKIDKMAGALLGFCSEAEQFSFQEDVFSKLRDYFLARIQRPNFLSIQFPAEKAKLVSAFSSAEEFKMCSICTSPMILPSKAPNCNPSSLCHSYCLSQTTSCPFCRGISGITCQPPRVRETLPTLESRPHSGLSRTVARPNPKKTRGVSVAPVAARRSPSPSRVGIRGVQSRQGRGLPRVGAR